MLFTPKLHSRIVSFVFSLIKIDYSFIQFVDSFKYIGHYITSDLVILMMMYRYTV